MLLFKEDHALYLCARNMAKGLNQTWGWGETVSFLEDSGA